MRINTDPTMQRIVIIAIIEFLIAILLPLQVLLQGGHAPTTLQVATIIVGAAITLLTYFATFLKTSEAEPENKT